VIVARPGEPLAERAGAAGLAVLLVAPRSELDPLAAARVRRAIRESGAEIVHAHTGHAVALAALATVGTRARMVVTRRVDFALRRNWGTRLKFSRAAAVIAISRAVADVLVRGGMDPARIEVVPSGIDLRRTFAPAAPDTLAALGVPAGAPLVVQVAQLVGHKDPCTFVRAFGAVRRAVPAAHALLVGDGPLRAAVAHEIARHGLGGAVHLTGYRRDADALLAAADVATLSSEEEGLGTVLLDALSMGKPTVATRAGGIPEIIEDGVSGLLAPIRDGRRSAPRSRGRSPTRRCARDSPRGRGRGPRSSRWSARPSAPLPCTSGCSPRRAADTAAVRPPLPSRRGRAASPGPSPFSRSNACPVV
jgi:glycosyltransferase involved in cell wall biosynthesis